MLSPSKILFSSNGIVKIDDFQFLDLKNTFLKQVQTRIRARQQMYLSPEQLLGKEADSRCDIFSTGVMAYKMTTGQHPFLEENSEWTTMQIVACNAKVPFELDPTLPAEIETLIERMIEKEPNKRIQLADEGLKVLDTYIDHFGEVRSYEVLANFLKKPQQSAEQLNALRADEFLQQAGQFELQEQWDKALIAFHRALFLKPRDKEIEQEIKAICARKGYLAENGADPKFLQLEQSLKSNPDNVQILERLAAFARSRGDLIKAVVYYKRILRLDPKDSATLSQIAQLLQTRETDSLVAPTDAKWARLQDFYRGKERSFWSNSTFLQGNFSLLSAVFALAILIGGLHIFHLLPQENVVNAGPPTRNMLPQTIIMSDDHATSLCNQAFQLHELGKIKDAIEILSKSPLPEKGRAAAYARLMLSRYWLESDATGHAIDVLERIDLPTAGPDQVMIAYKLKAEAYQRAGNIGRAIDQYINIEALPGLSTHDRNEADQKVQSLQNEALLNQ